MTKSILFFFSSRRRHTRSLRDWSSDVCSSDLRVQDIAGRTVDRAAQPDCRRRPGTAQIEIAVLQPRLLADLDVLVDLERQRRRFTEHVQTRRGDLDLTARQARVDVALR